MALLPLRKYPDPILAKVCQPILNVNEEIRTLVNDMVETMYEAPGVGLAAPQVGHSIRLIVMDASGKDQENDLIVLINPELELFGECIKSSQEGCLSVPFNYRSDVQRFSSVRVKFIDLDGNTVDEIWHDFKAIVIQHEYDHLQGKLFIDHISRLRRTMFDNKVKKNLKKTVD